MVLPTALRWVTCRGYATKKDKQSKKEKAGKAATKATFNLDEAPIDLDRVKQGLEDIAANLKEDLAKFRPGKAGPGMAAIHPHPSDGTATCDDGASHRQTAICCRDASPPTYPSRVTTSRLSLHLFCSILLFPLLLPRPHRSVWCHKPRTRLFHPTTSISN